MSIDYGLDNTSWALQIFNVQYPNYPLSSGWYAPDGFEINTLDTCSFETDKQVSAGMSSYVDMASSSMHGSVGAYGVKLGASHTSAQYQSSFTEDLYYMFTESATCLIYQAELDVYDPPSFTTSFRNAVATLPDTYES